MRYFVRSKTGAVLNNKLVYLVIMIFFALFMLQFFLLGDDAKLVEGNKKAEDAVDTLITLSKERNKVDVQQISADPKVVDFWRDFSQDMVDIQAAMNTKGDRLYNYDYCLYSFDIPPFSKTSTMVLIPTSTGVLVQLMYTARSSSEGVYNYESISLNGFNVKTAGLTEPQEGYFPDLNLKSGERIKFIENGEFSIGEQVDESKPDKKSLLSIQVSHDVPNNFEHPVYYARIYDPSSIGMVLVSKDSIVFPYAADGNEELLDHNLFNKFTNEINNGAGLPFCDPSDELLLVPLREDIPRCRCSMAENQEICEALSFAACGEDCKWESEYNGMTLESSCEIIESDTTAFEHALLDIFEGAIDYAKDDHGSCVFSKEFIFRDDEPIEGLSNDAEIDFTIFKNYVRNMKITNKDNQVAIFYVNEEGDDRPGEKINYPSDLSFGFVSYGDKVYDSIKFDLVQRLSDYLTIGYLEDDNYNSVYESTQIGKDENRKYNFVFEKSPASLSFISSRTATADSRNFDFCDLESAYNIEDATPASPCSDVKSRSLCLVHEEDGENCVWYKHDGLFSSEGCRDSEYKDAKELTDGIEGSSVLGTANEILRILKDDSLTCYKKIDFNVLWDDKNRDGIKQDGENPYGIYLNNIGNNSYVYLKILKGNGNRFVYYNLGEAKNTELRLFVDRFSNYRIYSKLVNKDWILVKKSNKIYFTYDNVELGVTQEC